MEEDRAANQRSAFSLSYTLGLYISNGFGLRVFGCWEFPVSQINCSHSDRFNSWMGCLVTDGIYKSQKPIEKCCTKSVLKWCKQIVQQKMQLLQLCKVFFCVFWSFLHCDRYNDFRNIECHTFECCTSGCQMSSCHDNSMSYMGSIVSYMGNNYEELPRLCSQPSR